MNILLMNPYIQYLSFNLFVLFLYLLSLTDLYHVNVYFVAFFISILFFFSALSIKFFGIHKKLLKSTSIERYFKIYNTKVFNRLIVLFFIVGAIAALYQAITYGTTLLAQNKVSRINGDHYVGYLVDLLQLSMCMSYIAVKFKTTSHLWLFKILFIASVLLLFLKLNRGAYSFMLIVYIYVTYIQAYIHHKKRRWLLKMGIIILAFAMAFGAVGNMRLEYVLENIYHTTVNQQYGMSDIYPSSFVWVYIYITSPLENASQILINQEVWEYHFGFNLFYAFLAPISKWIWGDHGNLFPPLDATAGLNVSTFIPEAIVDFGIFGPYIYMLYLVFLYYIAIKSMRNIYGFLCFLSIVHSSLWLIFTNAFSIGPNVINYLLFLVMAWISKSSVENMIVEPINRTDQRKTRVEV